MAPNTNTGAATPVELGGSQEGENPFDNETRPQDESGQSPPADDQPAEGAEPGDAPPSANSAAMRAKVINDSVAYIRSLAEEHGRNADWAEKAVREAASVTSREALELGVIDLIASDLDDVGLDEMLDSGQDLRAAVLVYPHHGGRSGAGSESEFAAKLLTAVEPRTVLFSIARGVHRNPLPEVIQAVRAAGAHIRIACTELSRNCAEGTPFDEPLHLLPLAARGRATRSCCGGTFRLELREGATVEPGIAEHAAFIAAEAPTALCAK